MTNPTLLDQAHEAMVSAPEDDAARLRFYERLADSELFLMLDAEAEGETISPRMFELDEGCYTLVFDREERLADFAAGIVPYAAMSGRTIVQMLGGQGIGLGVNLGVAPSSIMIPQVAIDWLAETLSEAPDQIERRPSALAAPSGLPESLLVALDAKLSAMAGLAKMAYLAQVTYDNGQVSHLLAFVDPLLGAEAALAQAVNEALTFSGIEAGALDVSFFSASDQISARLAQVGLRFDVPTVETPQNTGPSAPGRDPNAPPKLR